MKQPKQVYILGYPHLQRSMLFYSHWDGIGHVNEVIENEGDNTYEFWEVAQLVFGGN